MRGVEFKDAIKRSLLAFRRRFPRIGRRVAPASKQQNKGDEDGDASAQADNLPDDNLIPRVTIRQKVLACQQGHDRCDV